MAKANNTTADTNADKKEKVNKDIVLVEFIKSWTPYVRGEVAGFDKKMADKLLEAQIVVEYKKSK